MVYVSEGDLSVLLETAHRLSQSSGSPTVLIKALLEQVPPLFHADVAAVLSVDFTDYAFEGFVRAPRGDMLVTGEPLAQLLPQHPLVGHYTTAPRLEPHIVSEFVDWKSWKSSAIFDVVYRRLGTPYALLIPMTLTVTGGKATFLDLTRNFPDFTPRERDMARVLQGPIIVAYRTAESSDQCKSGPQDEESITKYGLTPREIDVAKLLAEGRTAVSIGRALSASPRTVGKHLEHIYLKTGAHDRLAVAFLMRDWF